VLAGRCRRLVFLGDLHVAREHEAGIQLLERAARVEGVSCRHLHNPPTAERWALGLARLLDPHPADRRHVAAPPPAPG